MWARRGFFHGVTFQYLMMLVDLTHWPSKGSVKVSDSSKVNKSKSLSSVHPSVFDHNRTGLFTHWIAN